MESFPDEGPACMLYHLKLNNYMNPSEFERNKPRQTYAQIDGMISKYRNIVNEHTMKGQTLIMESTDNARHYLAQEVVADLERLKAVFLSGQ